MDDSTASAMPEVKADELDVAGPASPVAVAMSIADTGFNEHRSVTLPDTTVQSDDDKSRDIPATPILLPSRPQIHRKQPQPPPPQQPPPPPAPQAQDEAENPTDSLSLMQLRRMVTDMPRFEPTAYAFVYEDGSSFPDEIEEWFSYESGEQASMVCAKIAFDTQWDVFTETSVGWIGSDLSRKRRFIEKQITALRGPDVSRSSASLEALAYLALGAWAETASGPGEAATQVDEQQRSEDEESGHDYCKARLQIQCIKETADIIYDCNGAQAVFDLLRRCFLRVWDDICDAGDLPPEDESMDSERPRELENALTLMYVMVEVAREQAASDPDTRLRNDLAGLQPDFLLFQLKVIARLRWDELTDLPLRKLFLLFWKSILLLFGGSRELQATKDATRGESGRTLDDDVGTRITASPLDYHLFRQEITSKYPAYNPPPPLIPLESENNSILPPLPNHASKNGNNDPSAGVGPANVNGNGGSILHQPVHIATPAPSPPPSPIGPGGKAGKKQNYQTNQNLPFLYPPLAQEIVSDRSWQGSDVPASILEAGELFAGRMRMTRAMQQLWEERERLLKFERGWDGLGDGDSRDMEASGEDSISDPTNDSKSPYESTAEREKRRRLEAVEDFYRNALPHLQSLVIVLLKVVLANVTSLISQPAVPGPNGLASGYQSQEQINGNPGGQFKPKSRENTGLSHDFSNQSGDGGDHSAESVEELDSLRCREITAKAVSGLLLLLLKWFKISHVLKFEYLTQLLLDSNYLPLILKLFAHQDLDKCVEAKTDREELQFFAMCRHLSHDGSAGKSAEESGEDEACPPPVVRLRREEVGPTSAEGSSPPERSDTNPETDESGNAEQAAEPITNFSWRNFFSSINYLRIMQKICKDKAHRNLLLVQYKSSTILKKSLKVPQPQLRLYTLKLFKNQVPYCGRKWRQTNMRVITAVYLYCRPELRDDWLAGSDVDAEVEEALPLEQALRALTHWHNLKRYPEQMGADTGVLEEEQDFFIRELDKMDFGDDGSAAEEGNGERLWEGPLHMEGW